MEISFAMWPELVDSSSMPAPIFLFLLMKSKPEHLTDEDKRLLKVLKKGPLKEDDPIDPNTPYNIVTSNDGQ